MPRILVRVYSGTMDSLGAQPGSEADYDLMLSQAEVLWAVDIPLAGRLANLTALARSSIPGLNWVGFYLWEERRRRLVLGPFQGLPACAIIPEGKGVCGAAIARGEALVVDDVEAFPGHIACDSASRSEIVVPLAPRGRLFGVLDIDSPLPARFGARDAQGIRAFAHAIESRLECLGTEELSRLYL